MVSIAVYEETKIFGEVDRIRKWETYCIKITIIYECRRIEIKKYFEYEKKICLRVIKTRRCKLKLYNSKKKRII